MGALIEVKDLTFAYPTDDGKQAKNALDGVSLSIEEGSQPVINTCQSFMWLSI